MSEYSSDSNSIYCFCVLLKTKLKSPIILFESDWNWNYITVGWKTKIFLILLLLPLQSCSSFDFTTGMCFNLHFRGCYPLWQYAFTVLQALISVPLNEADTDTYCARRMCISHGLRQLRRPESWWGRVVIPFTFTDNPTTIQDLCSV